MQNERLRADAARRVAEGRKNGRPRPDDRKVLNGVFFVLRTWGWTQRLRQHVHARLRRTWVVNGGARTQICENNPMQSRIGPGSQHVCAVLPEMLQLGGPEYYSATGVNQRLCS